jgi:hypothetical protein
MTHTEALQLAPAAKARRGPKVRTLPRLVDLGA